jgi:hypothetical protein
MRKRRGEKFVRISPTERTAKLTGARRFGNAERAVLFLVACAGVATVELPTLRLERIASLALHRTHPDSLTPDNEVGDYVIVQEAIAYLQDLGKLGSLGDDVEGMTFGVRLVATAALVGAVVIVGLIVVALAVIL